MSSSSRLILFAAGIIAGVAMSVTAYAFVSAGAEAQRALGPYYISQHSNPNAVAGVFRVNQTTGYMSYCYIDASGKPTVSCTAEVP
jgi:hypothetical protein